MMKKITMIALALVVGLILASGAYAWWGGHGMGYGTGANIETVKKFQKETLNLRDELMTKQMELQNEYNNPVPDTNRVAALKKEIIDLRAKIQTVAEKHGISAVGPMGRKMMGRGMMGRGMMQQGMMGTGMGMCGCPMCR